MVDWFVIVKSSQGTDIAWCFNGHFVTCPQEKLGHQVDPLLAASRQQDVINVNLDSEFKNISNAIQVNSIKRILVL